METFKPNKAKGLPTEYRRIAVAGGILGLLSILLIIGLVLTKDDTKKSSTTLPKSSTQSITSSSNLPSLIIKELGVKINLPASIKDTTFVKVASTNSQSSLAARNPTVKLELQQYSDLVSKCLGNKAKINYPYAVISKVSGKAAASNKSVLKQFDTFYIQKDFNGVDPACQNPIDKQNIDSLYRNITDDLQTAFSNAQQI